MNILKTADLKGFGKKQQGKVRDFYIIGGKRIIITTDRQSAFDVNLGFIPYKGAVLNLLAAHWFVKTKDIIQNHLIATPDPNVTNPALLRKLAGLGVEVVTLAPVTRTLEEIYLQVVKDDENHGEAEPGLAPNFFHPRNAEQRNRQGIGYLILYILR